MNRPVFASDLDDAAFRARLAPLAASVLPTTVAEVDVAGLRHDIRVRSRWPFVVIAALAGVAVLACGAWFFIHRPSPAAPAAAADKPSASAVAALAPTPSSGKLIHVLMERGNAAFATGDITAARLLYERAANEGSAEAALALGKTYDIVFLLQIGARGSAANQYTAAKWYRRAADLGDRQGTELLSRVAGGNKP